MIDPTTQKTIQVSTNGGSGPSIQLPLSQLDRVRQLYRNHGYYHVRVAHDVELPAEGDLVRAVVYLEEGPPVFVESVGVTLAGEPLPDAERNLLLAHVPVARGQVFNADVYARALAYLRTYYREHGFARVDITRRAEVDPRRDAAAIEFHVDSGPTPFDISLNFGPFGLGIDGGSVTMNASMRLGTDARLSYEALVSHEIDPSLLIPSLGAGASWDIELPFKATGFAWLVIPDFRRKRLPVCRCDIREIGHEDIHLSGQLIQEIGLEEANTFGGSMAPGVALSQFYCVWRGVRRPYFGFREGAGERDSDRSAASSHVRDRNRIG